MRIEPQNLQKNTSIEAVSIGNGQNITGKELKESIADMGITTMSSTAMAKNGIMEGLCTDGTLESVKENAKTLKQNLGAMIDKMDMGELVTMDQDGVDINDMEPDEIVTVVEQIQIQLATWCDDFSLVGTTVDREDIERVAGTSVNAAKLSKAMKDAGMEPTKPRMDEAMQSLETYESLEVPSEDTKAYLIKNNTEPTIRNVYMAEHSVVGMSQSHPVSDEDWSQLRAQVEKMLQDTPLAGEETYIDRSRMLLEHDIEVTSDNLVKLSELDSITEPEMDFVMDRMVATMIEGRPAQNTLITGQTLPWEEAAAAVYTLNNATDENVMAWSSQPQKTLDVLSDYVLLDRRETVAPEKPEYIKAQRQVLEARLLMTLQAGRALEKQGISINTLEISDLIDSLKAYEKEQLTISVRQEAAYASYTEVNEFGEVSIEEVNTVTEITVAYEQLKTAPHVVIGAVMAENRTASANHLLDAAQPMWDRLKKAEDSYEALQTEIRTDLGDSLKKAVVASADSVLSELGYEDNSENRRALRIMAFHQMEISGDNMARIKNLDSSVNRLFNELTPEKTLRMLRAGVDPLNTGVDELADYLSEMEASNEKETRREQEKYSEFLYRMEMKGEISEEERTQYIGVYSMLHRIEKDGRTALGGILLQGSELTMANLLTAYMSGKDRGMNIQASEDMDSMKFKDTISYYRNIFHGLKNRISPESLAQAFGEDGDVSPEQFVKELLEYEEYPQNNPVYERRFSELQELGDSDEEVLRYVSENQIPATLPNLKSAKRMLQEPVDFAKELLETEPLTEAIHPVSDVEELQQLYDEASKNCNEETEKMLGENLSSQDFDLLRNRAYQMSLIQTMAHQNNYYIPYENEAGEAGVMNVRILHQSDSPGRFMVRMESENYGRITAEGVWESEHTRIQIMCENRDGLEEVEKRLPSLEENYQTHGFDVSIQTNLATAQPVLQSREGVDASVNELFKLAQLLVQELTQL